MNIKDTFHTGNLHNDQRGIMTMVVTVLVLIVMSITAMSMSVLARREEKQSMDAVMSVQASNAVESGINDAIKHLADDGTVSAGCTSLGSTSNTLSMPSALTTSSDANLGLYSASSSYPCVRINNTGLSDLKFSNITADESAVSYVNVTNAVADTAGTKLLISWESSDNSTDFRTQSCPKNFPNATTWLNITPMLRVDIVIGLNSVLNRANLIANSYTLYLNPCIGTPQIIATHTINLTTDNAYGVGRGAMVKINCINSNAHIPTVKEPLRCTAIITLGGTPTNSMAIRLHPIYNNARVVVKVFGSSDACNNAPLTITGAQKSIDVTGKSSDVLKRKEIRIGSGISRYLSAIDVSGPMCKRIKPTMDASSVGLFSTDLTDVSGDDNTDCTATL